MEINVVALLVLIRTMLNGVQPSLRVCDLCGPSLCRYMLITCDWLCLTNRLPGHKVTPYGSSHPSGRRFPWWPRRTAHLWPFVDTAVITLNYTASYHCLLSWVISHETAVARISSSRAPLRGATCKQTFTACSRSDSMRGDVKTTSLRIK